MNNAEKRWAVFVTSYGRSFLAGRYCWQGATKDDIAVPTFRTRKLCREAISRMNSYRKEARPVKVTVTIEIT